MQVGEEAVGEEELGRGLKEGIVEEELGRGLKEGAPYDLHILTSHAAPRPDCQWGVVSIA